MADDLGMRKVRGLKKSRENITRDGSGTVA
jgi:hypothetical protein